MPPGDGSLVTTSSVAASLPQFVTALRGVRETSCSPTSLTRIRKIVKIDRDHVTELKRSGGFELVTCDVPRSALRIHNEGPPAGPLITAVFVRVDHHERGGINGTQ